jgi:hypothetical protein
MTIEVTGQPTQSLPASRKSSAQEINFPKFTVTSLAGGFFLIPLHEFGHILCDWITGHPAAMSYARDYLLSGEKTPFWGLLGGPVAPLLMSTVSVILIYRGINLSITYPLAVLGTLDRLLLYLSGSTPSDERDLASAMAWPQATFKYIFLSCELLLLALILLSLVKYRPGIWRSVLIFAVPPACFIAAASLGFLLDRYAFPEQHKKEFGLIRPDSYEFCVGRVGYCGTAAQSSGPTVYARVSQAEES